MSVTNLVLTLLLQCLQTRAEGLPDLYDACQDELPNCPELVAAGHCTGDFVTKFVEHQQWSDEPIYEASMVIAQCWHSCKRYFNEATLTDAEEEFVFAAGGKDESAFIDMFGVSTDVCDIRKGWTWEAKRNLVMNSVYAWSSFRSPKMPRLTKSGYFLDRAPEELWNEIRSFYDPTKFQEREALNEGLCSTLSIEVSDEECVPSDSNPTRTLMQALPDELADKIGKTLLAGAEQFSGIALTFDVTYGIRRYVRNTWFTVHTDRPESHVIGAIINVGQRVDQPWPLQILDHEGQVREVILEPGDLLWYEAAKLPHARARPLNGSYFDNLFVHYYPPKTGKPSILDVD